MYQNNISDASLKQCITWLAGNLFESRSILNNAYYYNNAATKENTAINFRKNSNTCIQCQCSWKRNASCLYEFKKLKLLSDRLLHVVLWYDIYILFSKHFHPKCTNSSYQKIRIKVHGSKIFLWTKVKERPAIYLLAISQSNHTSATQHGELKIVLQCNNNISITVQIEEKWRWVNCTYIIQQGWEWWLGWWLK